MKMPKNVRLVVVDVQKDFLPGGSLAVPNGDKVIEPINRLIKHFGDKVIFTKDNHPPTHGSFASNHPGAKPFEMGELDGRPQVMWPDHCVVGTPGAELADDLDVPVVATVVQKGTDRKFDSFSAFKNDGGVYTPLKGVLQAAEVNTIVVCGLATDYCVKATALDGRELGFKVILAVDACRGVDMNSGDVEKDYHEMADAGIVFVGVEAIVNPGGMRILPDGGLYEE